MINIFLEKSCPKCSGESNPFSIKSFSIKSKLSISLNQQSEILYSSLFFVTSKSSTIETKVLNIYFYLIQIFLMKKERPRTSLAA